MENLFSGGIIPIPCMHRLVSWLGKPGDKGGEVGPFDSRVRTNYRFR